MLRSCSVRFLLLICLNWNIDGRVGGGPGTVVMAIEQERFTLIGFNIVSK